MTKIASTMGVSGSYLGRVCAYLHVPRPEPGYWAKIAAGRTAKVPALPAARPGDPTEWTKDVGFQSVAPINAPDPPPVVRNRPRAAGKDVHALLSGARVHFESSRPVEDGAYLKPFKKLLVDIVASKNALEKALTLANELFNGLETAGHRVTIAHSGEPMRRVQIEVDEAPRRQPRNYYPFWSPSRPTVVYVGSVAVGLAIVEMSESVLMRYVGGKYVRDSDHIPSRLRRHSIDPTWTRTREMPSGKFRVVAYAPYCNVSWQSSWQESATKSLMQQVAAIVKAIEIIGMDMVERVREANRQSELARKAMDEQFERMEKDEDLRRINAAKKESRDQLMQIMDAWLEVTNLERFFQGVSDLAASLPSEEQEQVIARLDLARKFVGSQDPMSFFLSWKTPLDRYEPEFPHEE